MAVDTSLPRFILAFRSSGSFAYNERVRLRRSIRFSIVPLTLSLDQSRRTSSLRNRSIVKISADFHVGGNSLTKRNSTLIRTESSSLPKREKRRRRYLEDKETKESRKTEEEKDARSSLHRVEEGQARTRRNRSGWVVAGFTF